MTRKAVVDSFCHNQKKCGTERVNRPALFPVTAHLVVSQGREMVGSWLVRRWTQADMAATLTSVVDTYTHLTLMCCRSSDFDRDLGESLGTPGSHLPHGS